MKNSKITSKRLKELLTYDPETGLFTWIVDRSNIKAGTVANSIQPKGYIKINIDKNPYLAHRLAWFYMFDEWPNGEIDHINRVKTDNRLVNLRVVSRSENIQNIGMRKSNTSGFKGVCFHKQANTWVARIGYRGKRYHLGSFLTPEEAHKAYKEAAEQLHTHKPDENH